MRKLYGLWELVKIWKCQKSQPIINISKQAREREIEKIASTHGILAAQRARAIALAIRYRENRRKD
jgi:hypothetical protein